MKKDWRPVCFTQTAEVVRRQIVVDELSSYPEVGVRCFGKRLFHKPARSGLEVGDKKLFQLKKGDFILQVTLSWEGAVGVVDDEDERLCGSVRVLTFEVDRAECTPRFLLWYFRTKSGVEQLGRVSPGSAGRNRALSIRRLDEVEIPLPPLAEQQRIVTRLDAIEERLTRAQKLREEVQQEDAALLRSLLHQEHCGSIAPTPMRELVRWRQPDTEVNASESYTFAGVYSFGRGVFRREAKQGMDFSYGRLTQVRVGEFTYPKLMAWEGALGVVPPNCDGYFVSPEFPVFKVDNSRLLPEILDIHFKAPRVWRKLADISTGTNLRRRRLNPNAFLGYEFPLPPMDVQEHVRSLARKSEGAYGLAALASKRHASLMPSLLDRVFADSQ